MKTDGSGSCPPLYPPAFPQKILEPAPGILLKPRHWRIFTFPVLHLIHLNQAKGRPRNECSGSNYDEAAGAFSVGTGLGGRMSVVGDRRSTRREPDEHELCGGRDDPR